MLRNHTDTTSFLLVEKEKKKQDGSNHLNEPKIEISDNLWW